MGIMSVTNLAVTHWEFGNTTQSDKFRMLRQARSKAIQALMWDEQQGVWLDYLLASRGRHDRFYPSNVVPLFAGCVYTDQHGKGLKVLSYLKSQDVLRYASGVPTSRVSTGQQWDFPNGWPPLVHMVITALADSGGAESRDAALNITRKWVTSNWLGWHRTQHMFEKYQVTAEGSRGGGGEYDVQVGFGWTNGVVLDLLNRYGGQLRLDPALYTTGAATPHFRFFTALLVLAASLGLVNSATRM